MHCTVYEHEDVSRTREAEAQLIPNMEVRQSMVAVRNRDRRQDRDGCFKLASQSRTRYIANCSATQTSNDDSQSAPLLRGKGIIALDRLLALLRIVPNNLRHSLIRTLPVIHLRVQRLRNHRIRTKRDLRCPQLRLHEPRIVEVKIVAQAHGTQRAAEDQRLVVKRVEGVRGVARCGCGVGVEIDGFALQAGTGDGVEEA